MDHTTILRDVASRPLDAANAVLDGIFDDALHAVPEGRGNSIAWLVWHAARQMDVQLAALSGEEQRWVEGGWAERLGVDRGPDDFGFGDSPKKMAELRIRDVAALREYMADVVGTLQDYVDGLGEEDLDDPVDTSYDPPIRRGVRLVSMIDDAIAHLGQAAYVRGLVDGWKIGY